MIIVGFRVTKFRYVTRRSSIAMEYMCVTLNVRTQVGVIPVLVPFPIHPTQSHSNGSKRFISGPELRILVSSLLLSL